MTFGVILFYYYKMLDYNNSKEDARTILKILKCMRVKTMV